MGLEDERLTEGAGGHHRLSRVTGSRRTQMAARRSAKESDIMKLTSSNGLT
jgi:hypothetical protein